VIRATLPRFTGPRVWAQEEHDDVRTGGHVDALALLTADHTPGRRSPKASRSGEDLGSTQEIPGRATMDHDELAATVAPPG